ncbi:771_t:CDS:2, partial [Gigaspora margarita]
TLQLELPQSQNAKNIDNTQDPCEIFEETVIDSGPALEYNLKLNSNEESFYPIINRNKEPSTYYIKDLIDAKLDQIQQLLKLRIDQLRLKK